MGTAMNRAAKTIYKSVQERGLRMTFPVFAGQSNISQFRKLALNISYHLEDDQTRFLISG
jgi:hypothetical protein